MALPYLSKNKNRPEQRQSLLDDEPHAFDLTWRNYVPSLSEFCCCFNRRRGEIRLLDDDDSRLPPSHFNDLPLYRGEAVNDYLTDLRDTEFDSALAEHSSYNLPPELSTKSPFGQQPSSSLKAKKKASTSSKSAHKKKRRGIYYHQQQQQQQGNSSSTESETVVTVEDDAGNIVETMCYQDENTDAIFLQDDLTSNLIYQPKSKVLGDSNVQSTYYARLSQPTFDQVHSMPLFASDNGSQSTTPLPDLTYTDDDTTVSGPSSTSYPAIATAHAGNCSQENDNAKRTSFISIEAAQTLLSLKLDDLTEKLTFIKENIMHIQTQPKNRQRNFSNESPEIDEEDEEFDRTTLHTIHRNEDSEIDSITSEALDIYVNTDNNIRHNVTNTLPSLDTPTSPTFARHGASMTASNNIARQLRDDNSDVTSANPTIFSSRRTEQQGDVEQEGISVQTVLNLGKKWLGV